MNKVLFRAFYDLIKSDEELLIELGLYPFPEDYTEEQIDLATRGKILPYFPSEYINLPRIVFQGTVSGRPNPDVPFVRDIYSRVHVQSTDETLQKNNTILYRISQLIEEETPQILEGEKIEWWSCFEYETEGESPLMVANVYSYFNEYKITLSPKNNKIILKK